MKYPNFFFERKLWRRGYKFVAGVDEVGRGSFAGPVVAAAAIFAGPKAITSILYSIEVRIDDSKKLKPRAREKAAKWIKENALAWGIGEIPASLINRIGMGKATKAAFRRAISAANKKLEVRSKRFDVKDQTSNLKLQTSTPRIQFLLIDAFFIPFVPGLPTKRRKDGKGRFRKNPQGRQKAIIDGDQKSLSIAAASIIAKVYRDRLMRSLGNKPRYKRYGWGRNKGYGTKEHQRAILKYGVTRYHRKIFVNSFQESLKLKTNISRP